MRRLEHLPGVERMEVGVVVAQAVGLFQNPGQCRFGRRFRIRLKAGSRQTPIFEHFRKARDKQAGNWIVGHGDLSQ
jgi:hypothetical protein